MKPFQAIGCSHRLNYAQRIKSQAKIQQAGGQDDRGPLLRGALNSYRLD
jgi:hypothetical protein